MGLINWLLQRFGWRSKRHSLPPARTSPDPDGQLAEPAHQPSSNGQRSGTTDVSASLREDSRRRASEYPAGRRRLVPTHRKAHRHVSRKRSLPYVEAKGAAPYRYARYGSQTGHYLDLSRDGDEDRLIGFGLPVFHTPEQLSEWIGVPLNRVAWLVHRFSNGRPGSVKDAHYHFHWVKKRRAGWRLIEAPKSTLKQVQVKILRELLDKIPVHPSAHGFTGGRSILTNARHHVGHEVLLKFDLTNFYTTVSFARVVAIFRSLGYSREAAIWLGLLTTSAVPGNLGFQEQGPYAIGPYLRRHLPQGAPTSPVLANLSAFGVDVRLSGLAKSFGACYTRYADDIAISGPRELAYGLRSLIPLVQQIVAQERFLINKSKRQVLRSHQRQTVTGVIVNAKVNISRVQYDRLKAILTNCLRHGPSTQNRDGVDSFYHYLQGSIAHVSMLNPERGKKLNELFQGIDWTK
jgi:RNA-directed DNA polymerase